MKRSRFLILGWLGLGLFLAFPSFSFAIEIAPASAQDILAAMGSDADGLTLTQESLPDLFVLTARHIEENPNQFFVEQPYLSGRWKGGKAVIEYARDMSYTMVSVYDKEGNRQRIYSVRTKYTEHVARQQMAGAASMPPSPTPAQTPSASASPSRSEEPVVAMARSVPMSVPATKESSQKNNYAWDDAKGAYVPVAVVPDAVDEDVKANPSPTENKEVVASAVMMPPPAPVVTPPVAPAPEEMPPAPEQPQTRRVRRIVKRKKHKAATQVKVGSTTWVEHSPDEDVVEEVVVVEEVPVSPKHAKKSKKAKPASEATPAVEATVASAPNAAQEPASPAPAPIQGPPMPPPAPPVVQTPAVAAPKPANGPPEKVVLHPAPQGEEWVPRLLKEITTVPKKTVVATPATVPVPSSPSPAPQAAKLVETAKGAPVSASVPTTEELLGIKAPVKPSGQASVPVEPSVPASVPAPAPAPVPVPVLAAVPAPVSTPPPAVVSAPVKESVPTTDELLAASPQKTGPDTSASDAWVPKATPKPADIPSAAPQQPVTVVMAPPVPVDNSVDNLLKMAGEGKSQMPHDGDAWVPRQTAAANPDADLENQVTRLRAQEKMKSSQKPQTRIKRDINNPEEGVLPVSSFEKFSGSMYGRHREYERRFYPGKRPHAKVPNHDFYVDEVDRKKEIHNVYYYLHQTGKAPKLVAVERHEKVSFLSNYDIEKEDKGKISTYH